MTYRTPPPPPSPAPHPASNPLTPLTPSVAIIEHLPSGQLLVTPCAFIPAEECERHCDQVFRAAGEGRAA